MSASDVAQQRAGRADAGDTTPRTRPRGERRLTIALWIGLCAAVIPLLTVVAPGLWAPGLAALTAILLATGYVLRRLGVPAVGVTVAEIAVWAVVLTAVFFRDAALLAVIPTPEVIAAVPDLIQQASGEILMGVAPIEPTAALSFIIVAAMGALTIALDHVVLTARMPLLASIALVAVWLIPAIAVPSGVNLLAFVLLASAVLILIRAETRTREAPEPGSSSGVTAVALAIGAVAVVAALVGGPALPAPVVTAAGTGALASIDPTLDLGNDLRRSTDATVLTMRTDAPQPPYLRVATLSLFDGAVWRPDRLRSVPLEEEGLEPVVVDEGMRVTQYRTDITITNLASSYLPVPFPAVAVDGLDGVWRAVPYSRTVLSGQTGAQGQDYEVVSQVPRPSAEQIRAADAAVDEVAIDVLSLPEDMPQIIGDLAHEVTADADTDYDRLIALQSWFRGPQFTYSLTAPVAAGFDDSGSEAVAAFLEVKEGYCVHFAGAFVLMARSLGMPSRIVVGFLPGSYTGQVENGQRIAEVKTSQLHAWPEVHFEGIGWVAFEPTKSLGTATRFLPQNQAIDEGGEDISGPTPTATASPRPTAAPAERPDDGPTDATGTATPMIDLRPYLTGVAIALILVSAPFLLRTLRRRMLARRAGAGDVVVAWRMVQEAAIDLGVPVPASESPRAFGTRLIAAHSAPVAEVSRLVAAIERASYAPPGSTVPRPSGSGASNGDGGMAADAESIRTGMLAALAPGARAQALILPRSLLIRPGSALASPAPATAR